MFRILLLFLSGKTIFFLGIFFDTVIYIVCFVFILFVASWLQDLWYAYVTPKFCFLCIMILFGTESVSDHHLSFQFILGLFQKCCDDILRHTCKKTILLINRQRSISYIFLSYP